MNYLDFPRVGERMYREVLENGLHVFVFPKPEFQKSYAFFATNYGGMDLRFCLDGTWHDTPAGVAHYLEHKMFDTKEGNALQKLTANGASPNAFTSNAITGYYFECTEQFEENLKTLLSFVSVPYFTQESVDKEQGIIGQEIGMIEDDPDWVVFMDLMQALYEKHKVLTYPRTDSRHLPHDMRPKVQKVFQSLPEPYREWVPAPERAVDPGKRVFDDAKITDHHAIVPTGRAPGSLTENERRIFDLVVRQLLAAFSAFRPYLGQSYIDTDLMALVLDQL